MPNVKTRKEHRKTGCLGRDLRFDDLYRTVWVISKKFRGGYISRKVRLRQFLRNCKAVHEAISHRAYLEETAGSYSIVHARNSVPSLEIRFCKLLR